MNAGTPDVAEADRRFRIWMRQNLDRAAAHFGLALAAEPSFGWRDRSIGAPADGPYGRRWLRVVSEQPQWASGHTWTGNADANALTGLPKPRVLAVHEWAEGDWRRQRAEVLTFLPGTPLSPADADSDMAPPDAWWDTLKNTLCHLAKSTTDRFAVDQAKVDRRVLAAFGDTVSVRIHCWETAHGDLHWANLLACPLGVLDWELWGRAPVGTDAATLYCYSIAAPRLAATVRRHFPVLETPDGVAAQLYVAARLLHRTKLGDHPHLAEPLRRLAHTLLSRP